MDDVVVVTGRLRLRRWRAADEEAMVAINRDAEVTRFLKRPVDADAVAGFLDAAAGHWADHGFGFFAVESSEPATAGELLGFAGVAFPRLCRS